MAFHHYVQKALMYHWSTPLLNNKPSPLPIEPERFGGLTWNGLVWCFDFATTKLEEHRAKRLFGIDELNSDEVEAKFGKLIDSPLASFVRLAMKQQVRKEPNRTMAIANEAMLRAVSLSFLIQTARGHQGTQQDALEGKARVKEMVSRLLRATDGELSLLAANFRARHEIFTFVLSGNYLFFMPQQGWFGFPLVDPSMGPVWGLALPLTPKTALVAVPKGVTLEGRHASSLAIFSLGIQPAKILVPAERVHRTEPEQTDLIRRLLWGREQMMALHARMEGVRVAMAASRITAGLPPVNTVAGSYR